MEDFVFQESLDYACVASGGKILINNSVFFPNVSLVAW